MTVLGIAVRSVRQRLLSSVLTAASVALGVGLVVFVVNARRSSLHAFERAAGGYDVILGGIHTSPLTTVLSTVFHVDSPIDTIPIGSYLAVKKDARVRYAVPYALGDVFEGFPVVGTTPELFDALQDDRGRPLRELIRSPGRVFQAGPDEHFEAVLGAIAAAESGKSIGDEFTVTHGREEGGHEHEDRWEVVGILEPTGTPNDRAVFIQLESFFHVEGHGNPAGGDDKDPWAVSAIVVRLKSPALRLQYVQDVRRDETLQAALPFQEIRKVFAIVEDVDALFRAVALLVVVVAGIAILVGLYNAIQGRRREIALLRALGARRGQVFSVVVSEAVLLCLGGGIVGLALGYAALAAAAPVLLERFGVRISATPGTFDLALLGALALMGVVVGALPAWRALRVPVAENLHPVD